MRGAIRVLSFVMFAALSGCTNLPFVGLDNARLRHPTGGPLIQAHRGGRGEYDDNALGGFRRALAGGIRGFETDVRFTRDGHLVLMHDATINRTTDGEGTVENLTLAELRRFRLRVSGEPIPTFEEFLQVFSGREDVFLEIELKAQPGGFYTPPVLEAYCRKLSETARRLMPRGTYVFICFSEATLKMMWSVDSSAPLGLLVSGGRASKQIIDRAVKLGCESIGFHHSVDASHVAMAKAAGLLVTVWTLQNADHYREAVRKGADRVTTDYPRLLDFAVRNRRKRGVVVDRNAMAKSPQVAVPIANRGAFNRLDDTYSCFVVDTVKDGPADEKIDVWMSAKGLSPAEVVVIGRTPGDGRTDTIVVPDSREFANAVSVLLK